MIDNEKRVAAAAKIISETMGLIVDKYDVAGDIARAALAAADAVTAETHWLAPNEATDAMLQHGRDALVVPDPIHVYVADHVAQIFTAMRDACIAEGKVHRPMSGRNA